MKGNATGGSLRLLCGRQIGELSRHSSGLAGMPPFASKQQKEGSTFGPVRACLVTATAKGWG
jgi:hypothetical protein